ncbi:hypothetical protein QF029_005749 [Priestia megaterium]|nr:hypothetical protein [Priestia megaterium]
MMAGKGLSYDFSYRSMVIVLHYNMKYVIKHVKCYDAYGSGLDNE